LIGPSITNAEDEALRAKGAAHLLKGGVPVGAKRRHHGFVVSFNALRTPVPAQRFRTRVALLALAHPPTAHARGADPKPLGSLTMRRPGLNRRQNPNPEIKRQRFRHVSRPPIRRTV
jgi:hypothetical protein